MPPPASLCGGRSPTGTSAASPKAALPPAQNRPARLGMPSPTASTRTASARSMTTRLALSDIRDYRRGSTRISAAIADATDAARLDLALGRPVLVVDSTDVDLDGKPLVTKRSRFAAERVEFLVENS